MKIEFIKTDPDELPIEALKYLSASIEKTLSKDTSLSELLNEARKGEGVIYLFRTDKVIGASYVEFHPGLLNIVHLSIDDISKHKAEIIKFFKELMRESGIENLCILSRVGWNRIIKELEPIGMLYTYREGCVETKN